MITDTTATTIANAATPTPTTSAISSDFQTFLKMLTVQLENQDPLNPVDSSDYAMQLATFSGVEQQVLTNDLLKSLATQVGLSGMAEMASWVGRDVRAVMPAHFDGAPVTVQPRPAVAADRAELVVKNAAGTVVQRMPIPVSANQIEWAGVGDDGTAFANGNYSFEVVSYKNDEVILQEGAEVYGRVQEVQIIDGQRVMMLRGGIYVSANAVTALRDS